VQTKEKKRSESDMMQILTKTELSWIYKALEREAMRNIEVMNQVEEGSPVFHLAELGRDNARSVMHKIHTVLNDGSKRIQIK
jgi:hypothetical protein